MQFAAKMMMTMMITMMIMIMMITMMMGKMQFAAKMMMTMIKIWVSDRNFFHRQKFAHPYTDGFSDWYFATLTNIGLQFLESGLPTLDA